MEHLGRSQEQTLLAAEIELDGLRSDGDLCASGWETDRARLVARVQVKVAAIKAGAFTYSVN